MKILGLSKYLDVFMYRDKVTIKRSVNVTYDDGSDGFEMQDIYKDIPCKLSLYNRSAGSSVTDRTTEYREDYRLTLSPNFLLKPNDLAIVNTHVNQKFTLRVIKPFRYDTHTEVSVRRESEA